MKELIKSLNNIGIEIEENHFKIPPKLPYMVYIVDEDTSGSDDKANEITELSIDLELYYEVKDEILESKIENVISSQKASYTKQRTYISTEQMWQVLYTFSFTRKKQ